MKRIYHSTYKEGTVKEILEDSYVVVFDNVGELTVKISDCTDIVSGL